VVLAHFVAIVEIDVSEDVGSVSRIVPHPTGDLGDQSRPALFQQLVIHGLVEVPEHVYPWAFKRYN
jgi:hypothetical protein